MRVVCLILAFGEGVFIMANVKKPAAKKSTKSAKSSVKGGKGGKKC